MAFSTLKVLSVVFLAVFVTGTVMTSSFLFDDEISQGNSFSNASLVVGMRSGQENFVSNPLIIEPGDEVNRDIYVQKLGSADFKYRSEFEILPGSDSDLCDALELNVYYNWYDALPSDPNYHQFRNMDLKYSGLLSGFTDFTTAPDPDMQILNSYPYFDNIFYQDFEHWFYYSVTLPSVADSSLQGKTCHFNIKTTAWQTNFSDESQGFSDVATLENTIATGSWQVCEEGPLWTNENIELEQGLDKNGSAISAGRSDVATTLGSNDGQFLSLGVDGWLVNKFERQIEDGLGNDLSIYEITYGRSNYPEERAVVDISQDGTNWFEVGTASSKATDGISSFDISGTGLSWFQFVRITDQTDYSLHGNNADGFDLDAIQGVYGICEELDPDESTRENIVINEVFSDVNDIHGTENKNEWIELYNNEDHNVNLKNWKLVNSLGVEKNINPNVEIPSHGFALVSHDNNTWSFWSEPSGTVEIQLTGSKAWLDESGDKVTLFDASNLEVDWVAWNNFVSGWTLSASEGESIARQTAGVDNDLPSDWVVLTTPNPGTNPHSHIHTDLSQGSNNDLLVKFTHADGFDEVRYYLEYEHLVDGQTVKELVQGSSSKELLVTELALEPIYLGTCSQGGASCVPHTDISNITLSLLYKNGSEILGTSTINFDWKNN